MSKCGYGKCDKETSSRPGYDKKYYYCDKHRKIRDKKSLKMYHENPTIQAERSKSYIDKLRNEFIKMYGGKCNCCGESFIGFLSLDHVMGDGAQARTNPKTGKPRNGYTSYKDAVDNFDSSRYQVLCMNCNCNKKNGEFCDCRSHRINVFDNYEDYERPT